MHLSFPFTPVSGLQSASGSRFFFSFNTCDRKPVQDFVVSRFVRASSQVLHFIILFRPMAVRFVSVCEMLSTSTAAT